MALDRQEMDAALAQAIALARRLEPVLSRSKSVPRREPSHEVHLASIAAVPDLGERIVRQVAEVPSWSPCGHRRFDDLPGNEQEAIYAYTGALRCAAEAAAPLLSTEAAVTFLAGHREHPAVHTAMRWFGDRVPRRVKARWALASAAAKTEVQLGPTQLVFVHHRSDEATLVFDGRWCLPSPVRPRVEATAATRPDLSSATTAGSYREAPPLTPRYALLRTSRGAPVVIDLEREHVAAPETVRVNGSPTQLEGIDDEGVVLRADSTERRHVRWGALRWVSWDALLGDGSGV